MEARPLETPLTVSEVNDRAGFVALGPEWEALVQGCDDQLFYHHDLLRIWIDNFIPAGRLRVLLVRDRAGTLVGALPLYEGRDFLFGVPVRKLASTANAHSCRFDLLARAPVEVARELMSYLRADRSWDVLMLTDLPEAGAGWSMHEAAHELGLPVGRWPSLNSPYVELPSTYEALAARLHNKFKANCRRRRRKLEEKGRVEFEKVRGGDALEARLEEGFLLEQSGWKGENGTAMAQAEATRGFYSELARAAQHAGRLSLSFLRLDRRAVAFHFALEHQGRYLLLKPGYDEALSDCSPGQLLMENVAADCIARGLFELDFLGPDMVWKRDWTGRVRPHAWLYVFRDTPLGRALAQAKFRWVPAAKRVVARWRKP
ncbi:MAG: GNAT family N-acetyltransferase [Myxococcota bacterium]